MTSKPHKIFGSHTARGMEPITGRNVQFPIMSKKSEYSEAPVVEKNYISPFTGYTAANENSLAMS